MPRDIPVGNGSVLVNFDNEYQLRDVYFPHVGMEEHSQRGVSRTGVYVDGRLHWIDCSWQRQLCYERDTLVTHVQLSKPEIGLSILFNDAVDFHANIFLRKFTISNLTDRARSITVYFHLNLSIGGNTIGETAFYAPEQDAVIHYKGKRYFLVSATASACESLSQWATGQKDDKGERSTALDAEDGHLGGNRIAQGAVDSVIGLTCEVAPGGERTGYYWMCLGQDLGEVEHLHALVRQRSAEWFLARTRAYWRLWVYKEEMRFRCLFSQRVIDLFRRSLLVLRTQIDNDGAIIAANDSDVILFNRDTYSYLWPRDGSLVASALIHAGYGDLAEKFFVFCGRFIEPEGYFLHKYTPDGSLASSWLPWPPKDDLSLPIQEDETALVLWALWRHFERFRTVEFIKPLYRPLIIRAAEFLYRFRDENGLPRPSYDLWEERLGVHTFTVAAVIAGLKAAANFAAAFGEEQYETKYLSAADEMRDALKKHMFDGDLNRYARTVTCNAGDYQLDMTLDASLCALFLFEAFPPDEPTLVSTMESLRDGLWIKTEIGGVARYENDYYHQVSSDLERVPGNPWFICTLWLAQWEVARAQDAKGLENALPYFEWVAERALPSGCLAEQVNPYTGVPVSVSPLTWSHATLVEAMVQYMRRQEELMVCRQCGNIMYPLERTRFGRNEEHDWLNPPAEVCELHR